MANGAVLIFLHADTRLPDGTFQILREVFADGEVQCGTFRISFDVDHWFLRFLSFASLCDLGLFRFGDQCITIRRAFFESLGGFPGWRLFEDIELVRRARRRTRIKRFPLAVTSSARRFLQNGIIRQQAKNTWYTVRYLLGTPPDKLATEYGRRDGDFEGSKLVIFLRYPRAGSVKTRLAAGLGDHCAAVFYRDCVARLMHEIRRLPKAVARLVWYTGGTEEEMKDWLGDGPCYHAQPDGCLGERLSCAVEESFRQGATKVIALASDVPDLSTELILAALRSLDRTDVVVGPTLDGGYYLIGMKRPYAGLFRNISWSTDRVYRQTLDAARMLGLRSKSLDRLGDIDTLDDLVKWLARSGRHSTKTAIAGTVRPGDP